MAYTGNNTGAKGSVNIKVAILAGRDQLEIVSAHFEQQDSRSMESVHIKNVYNDVYKARNGAFVSIK